jgi:hypothetical protein
MLHALTQLFLESQPRTTPDESLGIDSGPYRCPLGPEDHDDEYPVKYVRAGSADGAAKAFAVCTCGFRFTFTKTSSDDHRLPLVERFICSRHRPREWTLEQARREWLDSTSSGKSFAGEDRLRPIRNWLKKYDQEWYESHIDQFKSPKQISDAYAARDRRYLELLRHAIDRLKARGEVPFARQTLAAEAGLADHLVRGGFREGKHAFPKCRELLMSTPELKKQGAWMGNPKRDFRKTDAELAVVLKGHLDGLAFAYPGLKFSRREIFVSAL